MDAWIFAIIATTIVMGVDILVPTTHSGVQWIMLYLLFLISFKQE